MVFSMNNLGESTFLLIFATKIGKTLTALGGNGR